MNQQILVDQKLISDMHIVAELTKNKYVIMTARLSKKGEVSFLSELSVPKQKSTAYSSNVSSDALAAELMSRQLDLDTFGSMIVIFKRSTDMALTPSAVEANTSSEMLFCISNQNGELKMFQKNTPIEYTVDAPDMDRKAFWESELQGKFK